MTKKKKGYNKMPVNFLDEPQKTEEDKIMNKEVLSAKKKSNVKEFNGITADTVFEFHNLETDEKSVYPWHQFRHMISKEDHRKIVENPKITITRQDEYSFKMI